LKSRRLIRLGGVELRVALEDGAAKRVRSVSRHLTGLFASPEVPKPARAAPATERSAAEEQLLARVREIEWYHTIELGHGIVTPGFFDHRPHLRHYQLPASLSGQRVLDVATYNGFWAFEFERRGAREVVALDIDTFAEVDIAPARRAQMSPDELGRKVGRGFELAREVLGSSVRRQVSSVYALSPERFGSFDLVFCGDLLLHLMNPIRALQAIRSVTTGSALFCELYDPGLAGDSDGLLRYEGGRVDYVWWRFGLKTLERMIGDAGFSRVECLGSFDMAPEGHPDSPPHALFRAIP
jgi:tRNA (mo5U34)-methyltransferase